jgi:hypothetical protein
MCAISIDDARIFMTGLFAPDLTSLQIESILKHCQTYPSLAVETFGRNGNEVSPIIFLIKEGLELNMIQPFCQQFPRSVRTKGNDTENYPLHVACAVAHMRPVTGLIAYLSRQFPRAASTRNAQGDLPLHLLLNPGISQSMTMQVLSPNDVQAPSAGFTLTALSSHPFTAKPRPWISYWTQPTTILKKSETLFAPTSPSELGSSSSEGKHRPNLDLCSTLPWHCLNCCPNRSSWNVSEVAGIWKVGPASCHPWRTTHPFVT